MLALRPRQAGEDTRGIAKVVMGEKTAARPVLRERKTGLYVPNLATDRVLP